MGPKATFPSIIKTRPKNKDTHPGEAKDDDGNPKPKRRTPAEMKEVRRQQELAQQIAEQNSRNAIAAVGSVEDSLREEDIARQTRPNRQLENVPAFRPPASVTKGKDSSKRGVQDNGSVSESINLTSLILSASFPEVDNRQSESWPRVTVEKGKDSSKKTERESQITGEYFRLHGAILPCPADWVSFKLQILRPCDQLPTMTRGLTVETSSDLLNTLRAKKRMNLKMMLKTKTKPKSNQQKGPRKAS